ncbi:MAG: sporulation protein [Betaproteobacteria bacterium HGW-Betaproteobacteria-8]|nr:MAG: sporulation protein [Betaproteobacteria bacterium HGW-Betaproteobacteria-8]
MSRDYKNTTSRAKPASKGSPFFSGLLVGLVLGVGISVVLAIFITGGKSPFQDKVTPAAVIEAEENAEAPAAVPEEATDSAENPRFDFYTILPGSETQVTEQEIKQKEAQSVTVTETYFLQVGAFQTEQEADNMKAKLALQGVEAIVQTAEIPDKGTWHRVRVGPFSDINAINKSRAQLAENGFPADLIKVNSNVPN